MKKFKVLIVLLLFFGSMFYLVGCNNETHEHNYSKNITSPNCTEQGYTTYTCECGDTYIDNYVSVLGHNYGEWITIKQASCKEEGQLLRICEKCSYSEQTTAAKTTEHEEVVDKAVEPTCTTAGLTEGKHCSKCNEVIIKQEIVSESGHTYNSTTIEPTCTEQGYTIHACDKCNYSYKDSYVEKLEHIEIIDKAVESTCSNVGLTEGKHCSRCNEVLVKQEEIPMLEHVYGLMVITPTCSEQGYTLHTCDGCGDIFKTSFVDSISHIFDGGACTMCKCMDVESKNNELKLENERHQQSLQKIEENYKKWVSQAENKINEIKSLYGISTVYSYEYCYESIADIENEIAKLENYIRALSGDNSSSAAAQRQRYRAQIEELEEDKDIYYAHIDINDWYEEIELDKLTYADNIAGENRLHQENLDSINIKYECATKGHIIVIDEAVNPTCITNGKTEGSHCSNCGFIVVNQNTIQSLGHTEVIDPAVKETCTVNGKTEGSHCSICGDVIVKQEEIPMHHNEVVDERIEPTCTETGLTEGKHCLECNEVLVAQEEIDAKGHKEVTDDLVEPTCTETGLTEGKHCSECNGVLVVQEKIDAKGHKDVIDDSVEPTCTKTGLTEGKHCSECNEVLVTQEEVAAKGHDYVDYVCSECNYNFYTEGLNFKFLTSTKTYSIDGYTGSDINVVIPAVYNEKAVTKIDFKAFYECSYIETIFIPNSVLNIDNYAFYGCSSLINITIPDSVLSLGTHSFKGCSSLESVVLGNRITIVNYSSFYECSSLTSIIIPNDVLTIDGFAFYGCNSLTNVEISNNLTTIGNYAFYGCTLLEEILIPDSVISIGNGAFQNCSSLANIIIPEGLTNIGDYSFYKCSKLTNISIPKSITTIGYQAFYDCISLTDVIIPDSVISIGEYAFYSCSLLTNIIIPDKVTSIGFACFNRCTGLKTITLPEGITSIGKNAFFGCSSLDTVYYKGTIEQWNNIVIEENNGPLGYAKINFYESESDFEFALSDDGESYSIVKYKGTDSDLIIPSTYKWKPVTSIGVNVFYDCDFLKSVTIPDSIISIGDYAFLDCSSLENIIIPDSVTSIGDYSLAICYSLTTINFDGTKVQWENINKAAYWNYDSELLNVTCSDGDISIK